MTRPGDAGEPTVNSPRSRRTPRVRAVHSAARGAAGLRRGARPAPPGPGRTAPHDDGGRPGGAGTAPVEGSARVSRR